MPSGSDTRGNVDAGFIRDLLGRGTLPEIPSVRRPSVTRPSVRRARVRVDVETRRENVTLINDFVRRMEFEIHPAGKYRGGPTVDDVLNEYLPEIGKDFVHGSRVLDTQLKGALLDRYRNTSSPLTIAQLKAVAGPEVLKRIVARLQNRSRDVRIKANKDTYTRWKMAHGYDSRVGIKTGKLLDAVRNGRVKITYRRAA